MSDKVLQLGQSKPESEINVTPLIDVCLVLLVIFMIVTPLIKNPVELPTAKSGGPAEDAKQLTITVSHNGLLSVGSAILRQDELPTKLRDIHIGQPNRPLVVQADKRLNYGEIREVLRICRDAGFSDITLAVSPGSDEKAAGDSTEV